MFSGHPYLQLMGTYTRGVLIFKWVLLFKWVLPIEGSLKSRGTYNPKGTVASIVKKAGLN